MRNRFLFTGVPVFLKNRVLFFLMFFIVTGNFCVFSNPFMGSGPAQNGTEISDGNLPEKAQPSPVRTSAPKRELVVRQAKLRENLGNFIYSWKETGSSSVFFAILGVAFLYGILHALGPGHRKTVVFSLYIARQAPVWEPAVIALVLSLLHGGTALVLLLLLRGISGPLSGRADNIAIYMEGFTYLMLIGLASYLVIHALKEMLFSSRSQEGQNHSGGKKKDSMSLGALLLTGIYPCPGAILVLVLALTLDVVSVGAAAVLAMSVGMSIPVLAAGYLAWFGRTGLFYGLKKNEVLLGRISSGVELLGYVILLVFSIYIAMPFIVSLPALFGK